MVYDEVPKEIAEILGDITPQQLTRLVNRLMPMIIDYIDCHAGNGAANVFLNHKYRLHKEKLDLEAKN